MQISEHNITRTSIQRESKKFMSVIYTPKHIFPELVSQYKTLGENAMKMKSIPEGLRGNNQAAASSPKVLSAPKFSTSQFHILRYTQICLSSS